MSKRSRASAQSTGANASEAVSTKQSFLTCDNLAFMHDRTPMSLDSLAALMRVVFANETPTVMERYSDYDAPPRRFSTHNDVLNFAGAEASKPAGAVSIAIYYPDMRGRLAVTRISLNPEACRGAAYRFCCEGWGVIHAYLPVAEPVGIAPFISANSEKRAIAWASTYPNWDPPASWDWRAVNKHLRRLRRALRQVV